MSIVKHFHLFAEASRASLVGYFGDAKSLVSINTASKQSVIRENARLLMQTHSMVGNKTAINGMSET